MMFSWPLVEEDTAARAVSWDKVTKRGGVTWVLGVMLGGLQHGKGIHALNGGIYRIRSHLGI